MKILFYFISAAYLLLMTGCGTAKYADNSNHWQDVIVSDNFEIYVDTANIERNEKSTIAREKKIFTAEESRLEYIDKIKSQYKNMGNPNKANKWNDFSYYIYTSEYDCLNKRLRILQIEDYDSNGKLIQRTKTSEKNLKWLYVDVETIRDYTFFYVCDYGN